MPTGYHVFNLRSVISAANRVSLNYPVRCFFFHFNFLCMFERCVGASFFIYGSVNLSKLDGKRWALLQS